MGNIQSLYTFSILSDMKYGRGDAVVWVQIEASLEKLGDEEIVSDPLSHNFHLRLILGQHNCSVG